jgi:hypothetical protein
LTPRLRKRAIYGWKLASYFADFANEASGKDSLKVRCQNVKLLLSEP